MGEALGEQADYRGTFQRVLDECVDHQTSAEKHQSDMGAASIGRRWIRTSGCHLLGTMLGLDSHTGKPLYVGFIRNETTSDYQDAVRSIEERGYRINGLILDRKQSLFKVFSGYRIQMCQFHMKQIVRRYITAHPRLRCARELKELMNTLTWTRKEDFCRGYRNWKTVWSDTLNRMTTLKSGKKTYTHKRLRSAMHSIDFYLPYLFSCQDEDCVGMPNTNNKIEGTSTDLKSNLNNHSGMSIENRKRFICRFFLALK